jgi:hypothetical protein
MNFSSNGIQELTISYIKNPGMGPMTKATGGAQKRCDFLILVILINNIYWIGRKLLSTPMMDKPQKRN